MLVASSALLIPDKGIGYLIEAAAEVVRECPDVQFVHIGDGPLFEEYQQRVARLGLQEQFKFAGLLNLPEIAPLIASADVFTLPCTWGEAFSLVVLEAMAAGKPVIATRLGGNPEAVDHGRTGILVPPKDAGALAKAIVELRRDPSKRRDMAQESARKSYDFSVDRRVEETVALYHDLTQS
jgi:glycosyltransferase involved in cell wall biosynthesis